MRTRQAVVRAVVWATAVLAADVGMLRAAAASPQKIFDRYHRAVVAVTYHVETQFMQQVREVEGRDLGVVVSPDLVLLNGAVVTSSATGATPRDYTVHFSGGAEIAATYVGRDEFVNIAFLRLQAPLPPGVEPLEFPQREARLRVGDRVYVLALLPENLDPMIRLEPGSVVAAVKRPKPFLVTDLPVEEALGGPVFDARGRPVGVLSEIGGAGPTFTSGFGGAEELAAGMILPASVLRPLIDAPPRRGETRRAWLGITLQALDDDMAAYWNLPARGGIIVNSVVPGSPAEAAGLQEGDIIVGMNGAPIPVHEEDHVPLFVELVGSAGVGSDLTFDIIRDGKQQTRRVTLVAAPKSRLDAERYRSAPFEFTVRELVFADRRAFDLDPEVEGVLVSRVKEGGWADVGGLQTGDIIERIDDQPVRAPEDVRVLLEAAAEKHARKLVFFVRRFGRTLFVTVQPNWQAGS